jgi:hypothetical protein
LGFGITKVGIFLKRRGGLIVESFRKRFNRLIVYGNGGNVENVENVRNVERCGLEEV